MSGQKEIDQLRQHIEELAGAGDLDGAINKCNEFLEFYQSSEVLDILEKLQDMKKEQTHSIIEKTIEKAEPLWEKGEYNRLYSIYMKLYTMDPEHKKLENLIVKVRNKLEAEQDKVKEAITGSAEERVSELWGEGDYEKVIRACDELLDVDPTNSYALKWHEKAMSKYLDAKIDFIKDNYYKKDDFKGAVNELIELFERFGKEKKIVDAMIDADHRLVNAVKAKKAKIVDDALDKARSLLDEEKYLDAKVIVLKLESVDSGNETLIKFRNKLEKKLDELIDRDIITHIEKDIHPKLFEDFKRNPEGYVAI